MNTFKKVLFALALLSLATVSFGQTALTTTTLTTATGVNTTTFKLGSLTNITAPQPNNSNRTMLFIDRSAYFVTSVNSTASTVTVVRGVRGTYGGSAHAAGAIVYVGPDDNVHFVNQAPVGACTASNQAFLPVIDVSTGKSWTCNNAGKWGTVSSFYVPPTQCTFAPTTLTTTNTYPQIGASTVFVLNGTSNAAAGTNTLTCNILVPTNVTTSQGAQIMDITLFVGSQTTAPTSLGTSTLGSITFPAAATTETASTVTPVAVGGTVTTTSPTAITTVTTAGSFLTIKHTYANPIFLSTDLQILQYTMPFVQSAAAAMALNTPGLIVHFINAPSVVIN